MDSEQFVVFTLDNEAYGLPITRVQEIIRYTTPRTIPDSEPGIRGVICLRSKIIPVGDTRELLGIMSVSDEEESNVVIVESASGPCGLIVDAVTEVIRVDVDAIETDSSTRATSGIARIGDKLLVVIDVDALLPSLNTMMIALPEAA